MPKLPDLMKHFAKERALVKLCALALLLAPALLFSLAHVLAALK
jgi:hypothetical protein